MRLQTDVPRANLFEVLTYYGQALGDSILDLLDWCVRKISYLISKAYSRQAPAVPAASSPADAVTTAAAESPEESLTRQLTDMRFGIGVVTVTILRYLTEHIAKLPLSVRTRLLYTHGVALYCRRTGGVDAHARCGHMQTHCCCWFL